MRLAPSRDTVQACAEAPATSVANRNFNFGNRNFLDSNFSVEKSAAARALINSQPENGKRSQKL